jgi:hypothetical protein
MTSKDYGFGKHPMDRKELKVISDLGIFLGKVQTSWWFSFFASQDMSLALSNYQQDLSIIYHRRLN